SAVAEFDGPRARRLVEPISVQSDRDRYFGMCAIAAASSNGETAVEFLKLINNDARARCATHVAYVMASLNLEGALRVVEEPGQELPALGFPWVPRHAPALEKPGAHRLIERPSRSTHERPAPAAPSRYVAWARTAAQVALVANAVDYPHRGELAAHVLAERPT